MAANEGFDAIAEIPDDGSREHEVYARYGLCAYIAQTFETYLVALLRNADMKAGATTPNEHASHMEYLQSKTAGRLLRQVQEAGHLSDEGLALCQRAVDARNVIVHHYFFDHVEDFLTEAGMQAMVDHADTARELIENASRVARGASFSIGIAMGMTAEAIHEQMEKRISDVTERAQGE